MNATPKELQQIMRSHLEGLTEQLKKGVMMEPYNYSHFFGRLRKLGIDYPAGFFEGMEFAEKNGLNKLLRKMAKEGHWVKGAKR